MPAETCTHPQPPSTQHPRSATHLEVAPSPLGRPLDILLEQARDQRGQEEIHGCSRRRLESGHVSTEFERRRQHPLAAAARGRWKVPSGRKRAATARKKYWITCWVASVLREAGSLGGERRGAGPAKRCSCLRLRRPSSAP